MGQRRVRYIRMSNMKEDIYVKAPEWVDGRAVLGGCADQASHDKEWFWLRSVDDKEVQIKMETMEDATEEEIEDYWAFSDSLMEKRNEGVRQQVEEMTKILRSGEVYKLKNIRKLSFIINERSKNILLWPQQHQYRSEHRELRERWIQKTRAQVKQYPISINLSIGNRIGGGGYGDVYALKLGEEYLPVVVKILKKYDKAEHFFSEAFSQIPAFNQQFETDDDWDPQTGHGKFTNCGVVQSLYMGFSKNADGHDDKQCMLLESGTPGNIITMDKWLDNYSGLNFDFQAAWEDGGAAGTPTFSVIGRAVVHAKPNKPLYGFYLNAGNLVTELGRLTVDDSEYIQTPIGWIDRRYLSPEPIFPDEVEAELTKYKRLALKFLWQIVGQMACLEEYGLFHFDIKTDNILINVVEERVLLIDLGGILVNPRVFYEKNNWEQTKFTIVPPNLDPETFWNVSRRANNWSSGAIASSLNPVFIQGADGWAKPASLDEAKAFNLLAVSLLANELVVHHSRNPQRGYFRSFFRGLYWFPSWYTQMIIPPEEEATELRKLSLFFQGTVIHDLIDLFINNIGLFMADLDPGNKNWQWYINPGSGRLYLWAPFLKGAGYSRDPSEDDVVMSAVREVTTIYDPDAGQKIITAYGDRLGTLNSIASELVRQNPEILL
jgi:serine/threonine protein kinase